MAHEILSGINHVGDNLDGGIGIVGSQQFNGEIHIGPTHNYASGSSLGLENAEKVEEQKRRKECMRALFLTDPRDDRGDLIETKGERAEGTCQWIFSNEKYISWAEHAQSQLLWISGGPGKGKTMLSITLTQELESLAAEGNSVLYFFCSNGNNNRNNSVAILRGLIFQLLEKNHSLFRHILPLFDVRGPSLFEDTSTEALWRVFEAMVRDPHLDTVFCVLDGLDECDGRSIEAFAKKIRNLFDGVASNDLKWILLSRAEPEGLARQLSKFPHVDLDSSSRHEIDPDVQQLIITEVGKLADEKRYSADLQNSVRKKLLNGSQGSFLWVGFIIHDLRSKSSIEVMETLKHLPEGLEGMYTRILLQIREDRKPVAARILHWVAAAVRPLTLAELASALEVKPTAGLSAVEVMREQVKFCGYFIKIQENLAGLIPSKHTAIVETVHYNSISLIHQSAKDYLLANNGSLPSGFNMFQFNASELHMEITDACLRLLETDLVVAMSKKEEEMLILDQCTLRKASSLPYWRERDVLHHPVDSFLNYAFQNWTEHAKASSRWSFDLNRPFYQSSSLARDTWASRYNKITESGYGGESTIGSHHNPLHLASRFRISGLVDKILSLNETSSCSSSLHTKGSGWVTQKDSNGKTPLDYAAGKGFTEIVEALVKNVDCEELNATANAALWEAAQNGRVSTARYIWNSGAAIDATSFLAREKHCRQTDLVEMLLHSVARINSPLAAPEATLAHQELLIPEICQYPLAFHSLAFHFVAVRGNSENDEFMLVLGGEDVIEATSSHHTTGLCGAPYNSHLQAVRLLIKNSATNLSTAIEYTPIGLICSPAMISKLHLEGKDKRPCISDLISPLSLAVLHGVKNFLRLVEHGVSVNPEVDGSEDDRAFNDPFSVFLPEKYQDDGYYVIEGSSDSSRKKKATQRKPLPALSIAAGLGKTYMVQFLLDEGADVNPNVAICHQPLSVAVKNLRELTVQLLLRRGANPNPTKIPAHTGVANTQPLSLAAQLGLTSIAKILLENGANANSKEPDIRLCPLYQAVFTKNMPVVKLLVDHGAKFDCMMEDYLAEFDTSWLSTKFDYDYKRGCYFLRRMSRSQFPEVEWDWKDSKEVVHANVEVLRDDFPTALPSDPRESLPGPKGPRFKIDGYSRPSWIRVSSNEHPYSYYVGKNKPVISQGLMNLPWFVGPESWNSFIQRTINPPARAPKEPRNWFLQYSEHGCSAEEGIFELEGDTNFL